MHEPVAVDGPLGLKPGLVVYEPEQPLMYLMCCVTTCIIVMKLFWIFNY